MKNILHILPGLTLLLFTSCSFFEDVPKTIEEKVKKAIKDNNVPALSIGVIEDGEIQLLEGFGVMKRGSERKAEAKSIYQIASQSKMFTGIIVNNLIQEGKLSVEEPISTYLTKDITKNTKEKLDKIQLKHLMNHTSGISRDGFSVYSNRAEGEPVTKGYSKKELIADINKIELESEPGSQFQYSNSGYAIVGFICERVSGLPYQGLLKKYITDKYGLPNTSVNLNSDQRSIRVTPYRKDDRNVETKPSIMGMATPASAIYSNAVDLTKLLSRQMKAYRVYQENKSESSLILTNQTSAMDEGLQYGFGLIKEIKNKNIKYGHGGDADGFACEYFLNPQKNIGVVILTSSGGPWVGELANEILEDLK